MGFRPLTAPRLAPSPRPMGTQFTTYIHLAHTDDAVGFNFSGAGATGPAGVTWLQCLTIPRRR